ncbi:hypothetical protein PF005_g16458 [Phytophthora fragariae]|uniref:Uncharacterized protein n=1 Tax=Phytophthora fragariae TaxID=53985 RepID=A0A6A3TLQ6_9STRA|nr:hypothetical protein PF003_g31676 [Phytophthora fragariae]KAE8884435.1 hypothetical protein PF003_g31677 [Phytophthora fragariae]KAE8937290.1 hypothetical protein PF009_g12795 [Phytophthora fragariae]KAE9011551.1 hypothetical protein PF011_g9335 [Phytophthora fragariae]KAE9096969.1 hypothetical protein PF007_g16791 [Phytophthora fragariae]
MTSTIDPRAFAIAIELTNQLSSDGAFVDEHGTHLSHEHVHIPSNACADSLAFRNVAPDSDSVMDVPVESEAAHTTNSAALPRCTSWSSLIERLVDVSEEDLLAMEW